MSADLDLKYKLGLGYGQDLDLKDNSPKIVSKDLWRHGHTLQTGSLLVACECELYLVGITQSEKCVKSVTKISISGQISLQMLHVNIGII